MCIFDHFGRFAPKIKFSSSGSAILDFFKLFILLQSASMIHWNLGPQFLIKVLASSKSWDARSRCIQLRYRANPMSSTFGRSIAFSSNQKNNLMMTWCWMRTVGARVKTWTTWSERTIYILLRVKSIDFYRNARAIASCVWRNEKYIYSFSNLPHVETRFAISEKNHE